MLLVLRNLSQHYRSDSRTVDPLSIAHYISAVVCFHIIPTQGRCLKLLNRLPQLILLTGSDALGKWMVKWLLITAFFDAKLLLLKGYEIEGFLLLISVKCQKYKDFKKLVFYCIKPP